MLARTWVGDLGWPATKNTKGMHYAALLNLCCKPFTFSFPIVDKD